MTILETILHALKTWWPHILVVLLAAFCIKRRYQYGLADVPGPFVASFTDLWAWYRAVRGLGVEDYKLHRKYNSPMVRVGPRTVVFSDPEACRMIFGYKPIFNKSDFYKASIQSNSKGEPYQNLASTSDEEEHAHLRRPVAHAYALGTLLHYEPLVDSTIATFFTQLNNRFLRTGKECDMSKWLQMYAFDVIGELTFSHRLGFLETGTDVGNMMYHTSKMMNYAGIMGYFPTLDKWLRFKNPLVLHLISMALVRYSIDQIKDHRNRAEHRAHPDLTTRFTEAAIRYPDIMDDDRIAENSRSAIGAGSDTTAIVLRELVYQILKSPNIYARVMQEVKETLSRRPDGEDYNKPITWHEGQGMAYFQACVKECLRYHTPLGQTLLRDVPSNGTTLCGHYFPKGVVVGCNGWTIHRDKSTYGDNADEFDPERWLCASPEQLVKMERINISFGGGSRVCIGKNIALLEINKTVPEMLRKYKMRLIDPSRYRTNAGWLTPQVGLVVALEHLDQSEVAS